MVLCFFLQAFFVPLFLFISFSLYWVTLSFIFTLLLLHQVNVHRLSTAMKIAIMKNKCESGKQRCGDDHLVANWGLMIYKLKWMGPIYFHLRPWIDSLMKHNKSVWCKHRHLCWQQYFPCLQRSRCFTIRRWTCVCVYRRNLSTTTAGINPTQL